MRLHSVPSQPLLSPISLLRRTHFTRFALVLFAVVFFSTLTVTAPATLLGPWATQVAPSRVLLTNVSGTIWRGSATPVLQQQDKNLLPLQRWYWNIHVWQLFTGKLSISFWRDDLPETSAMQALLSVGQVELRNVQITLPAAVLAEVSPVLRPAQLQGKIKITSEHLQLTNGNSAGQNITGTAHADWQNAGSAMSPINPLGIYHLTLSGADQLLNITLTTHFGALILNGQGSWSHAQGLQFRGQAEAAATHKESLSGLLGHLGPQESPGVYKLTLISR